MDILEKLENDIKSGDWLKKRAFRGDKKELESLFWNVLAMVLLSSVKRDTSGEHYSPGQFQAIVVKSFNSVLVNASVTKEGILELGRGFPRGYWDKNQSKIAETIERLRGENYEKALHLHQSILGSVRDENLIKRINPYTINVTKFDTYQKILSQPVSETFRQIYPRQLIEENEADFILINNVEINDKLVQEYMKIAFYSVRLHYGQFLLAERMKEFFTENPDLNSFSEDKLV